MLLDLYLLIQGGGPSPPAPSPGVTVYYRVKSVAGAASSAWTPSGPVASILTLDAPAGVTATGEGQRVVLTWTALSGSYGSPVASIYGGVASGYLSLLGTVAESAGTYTATGLENGTRYYFAVSFANLCGTSALSAEVSAIPVCCDNEYTSGGTPSTTYTPGTTPATPYASNDPADDLYLSGISPSTPYMGGSAPSTSYTAGGMPATTYTPGECPG